MGHSLWYKAAKLQPTCTAFTYEFTYITTCNLHKKPFSWIACRMSHVYTLRLHSYQLSGFVLLDHLNVLLCLLAATFVWSGPCLLLLPWWWFECRRIREKLTSSFLAVVSVRLFSSVSSGYGLVLITGKAILQSGITWQFASIYIRIVTADSLIKNVKFCTNNNNTNNTLIIYFIFIYLLIEHIKFKKYREFWISAGYVYPIFDFFMALCWYLCFSFMPTSTAVLNVQLIFDSCFDCTCFDSSSIIAHSKKWI